MRLFMVADIEGLTGVYHWAQTKPGQPAYREAQELLMGDLLAALEGAHAGGADEIVIYDMHESGRNIFTDRLPSYARHIVGKPPVLSGEFRMGESYDGLIMLGNHAMPFTENSVLCHAYWMGDGMFSVNGINVGEIGMEALIAGQYGVPLLLVTGDLAAKTETLALSPDTRCAVVKEGAGYRNTAVCYPACDTKKEIYRLAKDAAEHASQIAPVTLKAPYTLRIAFQGAVRQEIRALPGMVAVDDKTYEMKGDDLHKMWELVNDACCNWLDV